MSRPRGDWSMLGQWGDPTPGDPDVVRKYAAEYSEIAEAIGRASTRLTSIADKHDAESKFIDKFRDQANSVAGKISKAQKRYSHVATAVAEYAGPLEDAQTRADAALRKAEGAYNSREADVQLEQRYTDELTTNSSLTPDERQHYTQLLQHIQQRSGDMNHIMAAAKAELQSAIESRDAAAQRAISEIQNVENSGGINDSAWQQWWDENGATIDTIVDVLGWIGAAALVVLAFIPGVDLIEFAIIAIVAVIVIANAAIQWNAGSKSPGEAILEIALALIPVGGAVAAKGAVSAAVRGAAESGLGKAVGDGVGAFTKKLIAKDLVGGAEKALEKNWNNLGKAIFTNEAKTMGQLQSLVKEGLSVNGVVVDMGKVVSGQAWKISHLLGPLPEAITEKVLKGVGEPIFDKLDGRND